jgi:hypothetical protein
LAISTGKNVTVIKNYVNLFIDHLFKEMLRGNAVRIYRFATFVPKLVGGKTTRSFGREVWIAPRVQVQMCLTKTALAFLNRSTVNKTTKAGIRKTELTEEEREFFGIPKRKDLKEVFDKILADREEKKKKLANTQNDEIDDNEEDIDDVDELYESEDDEDEEDI